MHLNEAENLVSDVIQELTFLVQEIYPMALQEKGLANTLREYIFEWENRNDTRVQFIARNERRLPLDIEQAIYRVSQEALANVARHRGDLSAARSLVKQARPLLEVSDLGRSEYFYRTRGKISEAVGDWTAAVDDFQRTLALCHSADERDTAARVLSDLARVYKQQARWRDASLHSSEEARLWRELADLKRGSGYQAHCAQTSICAPTGARPAHCCFSCSIANCAQWSCASDGSTTRCLPRRSWRREFFLVRGWPSITKDQVIPSARVEFRGRPSPHGCDGAALAACGPSRHAAPASRHCVARDAQ
jgi:tetratricopeptide (TPR) repeat protein